MAIFKMKTLFNQQQRPRGPGRWAARLATQGSQAGNIEYYIVLQIKRQIMYIMGRLGWHMSGQPMIFTYVQYFLIFQYSLIHDLALYIE